MATMATTTQRPFSTNLLQRYKGRLKCSNLSAFLRLAENSYLFVLKKILIIYLKNNTIFP
jgi:hypothetical protein